MTNPINIEDWHWEITRHCNQRCVHCIIGDLEVGEICTESALRAMKIMVSFGGKRLYITGGEPFLRKDLRPIVDQAKTNNFSVGVITNGILQDAIMPIVNDGLFDQIGISIDGDKTVHDLIRGSGAYDKTISTLREIVEVGTTVQAYLTFSSLIVGHLGRAISELIDLGVTSFHINDISYGGRVKKNRYIEISDLSEEEKIKIISSGIGEIIEIGEFSIDHSCAISPEVAYIDFNGNVYSCVELAMADPKISIANLFSDDFADKFREYYSNIKLPSVCRYSTYGTSGIDICLNHSSSCPLVKEV